MRIRVYAPPFGDYAPLDEDGFVELPEGSTLDALLRLLRVPFRRGAVMFCMVNHERARLGRILEDGDTVSFLALVSGG